MNFLKCSVSTQTFTVKTNIQNIDLNKFYQLIFPEEKDINFEEKKKIKDENEWLKMEGIIVHVKYQQMKKGNWFEKIKDEKKKKKKNNEIPSKKNFLNCITMIICCNKFINIKFFKNGVLQLTGCKHINHVFICLTTIYKELIKSKDCFIFEKEATDIIFLIKSVMRNIDFDLGYKINRVAFSQKFVQICEKLENVIVPDNPGNKMDVRIKIRMTPEEIEKLPIIKFIFPSKKIEKLEYKDCIDIIEHDKKKLQSKIKDKFISIFVFQNGKVLLSASDEIIQKKYFEWFVKLISQIENDIKPPSITKKTFLFCN
jgi:hypothetical protein